MHDSGVMLLPSTSGHLSVYYGGIISSDLDCSFPLGSYYHLGLWLWGVSLSIEAQGEVNLPHAASDYYQASWPALYRVKYTFMVYCLNWWEGILRAFKTPTRNVIACIRLQ